MKYCFAWFFCLALVLSASAQETERVMPDPAQATQDLAQRYRHALPPHQYQWLEPGDTPGFAGLWIEQMTAAPQGGVLLLHDAGQHPDWPRLIHELRQFLPETGWSTLAISLPAPPAVPVPKRQRAVDTPVVAAAAPASVDETISAQVQARLAAGMRELTRRGYLNLVVIAVGDASLPATRFLRNGLQDADNVGLVLIDPPPAGSAELTPLLGELSLQVLDIYTRGQGADRAARQRRATMARNPEARLTQVREQPWLVPWRDSPQPIARRVWGWLRNNLAGAEREVEFVDRGAP